MNYFRILFDSFIRLRENLKMYNYMKLKSIEYLNLSKNEKKFN